LSASIESCTAAGAEVAVVTQKANLKFQISNLKFEIAFLCAPAARPVVVSFNSNHTQLNSNQCCRAD
jgi:hypothetical protein